MENQVIIIVFQKTKHFLFDLFFFLLFVIKDKINTIIRVIVRPVSNSTLWKNFKTNKMFFEFNVSNVSFKVKIV